MVSVTNKLLKHFLIYTSAIILLTCGGSDGGAPTEPEGPTYIVNLVSLGGAAQKGPFNNGTIINIAELNNSLTPTGKNFTSQITDNSGKFSVSNVQMEFSYAQINASGFYFDEVGNKVSTAQLVLSGLSNLAGKSNMNVNVLSSLEMNRIKNLITGDNPLTFAQAKIQAQEEVLAIFGFSRSGVAESELLDITQSGGGNAKLLAISAILQSDRSVGELSELIATISTDITPDGVLNDATVIETLRQSAYGLDLAEIRSNLEARYTSLGLNVTIPNFESEVNNFYKPPVANDMSLSTDEDTDISITLDASDPEGESLTFTTVEVNNATVTISGNTATYSPDANFNGTDTFTYFANDGSFNSNTATVTIAVGAVDDEPTTNNINTSTNEDVSVVMNLTADEYDGESYSFSIVSNPSNGTVSLSGVQATYTPNQDWNGTDTFTFEATDDRTARTNVATATIVVNPVNDAPIANNVTTQTDENLNNLDDIEVNVTYDADNDVLTSNDIKGSVIVNNTSSLDITLDATDVDGDNLTYSVVATTNNGTVTISGSTATYEPTQDWNGTDTFTYKANDGTVDSNTATVTITVAAVNDAPVASAVSASTNEDTAKAITLSATDVDGDDLTYSVVTNPSNGSLGSVSGTGVTYTPSANWNGTDTFTYKANDGTADSNTATVTVTVAAVNDVPVSTNMNIAIDEDTPESIGLNATDIEGPTTEQSHFIYSIVSQPTNGTISIPSTTPNNTATFTPNANFNGTDSFTFKANDGEDDGNVATVNITINAVNDAPTTNDLSVTIDENRTARIVGINLDGADVDGDDLTYSVVANASNGSTSISGSTLTYTANQDWNGTETITYKANDGTLDSNTSTITITVTSVNDAPVASAISASTNEDTAKAITLSATDVEGSSLTYILVSEGNDGTAGITNNILTFTPTANWNGTTEVLYKANDGSLDSNTATVTITVAAVNDAPIAHNGAISTTEDNAISFTLRHTGNANGPSNDSNGNPEIGAYDYDVEPPTDWDVNYTWSIVSPGSNGTAVLTTNNDVTYTPNANWNGTDTFTFKANDGTADSNTATVTVTVAAVNDVPVASAVSASTNEDTAKAITLSATDVEGSSLTYSIVSNPSNGSLGSVSGTGVTYTPSANWNGTDTFTYKANDGTADSNTATVTVTVAAVNDVPVASAVSASTNEDTAKAITLSATDVEGSSLTYSIVSNPSNGSLGSVSGTGVTYTPSANWNGTDTFTYKANDGTADSNTATVTVTVAAVNDAPITTDIATTIDENRTARLAGITLQGTDVEGDNLTYSVVSNASNGSTSISGETLTYTANQDWNGTETITYKANDGALDSNTSTITVTVNAVNDAPVVSGSGDSSISGSLQFDGSSNHKVEFDVDWTSFSGYTTNTASEGDGIEDFTISMWVKLDEVDTPYYFIDNQSGNTDLLAFNINTANQLQLYYQGNGGYRTLFTGSNPLTSANEWYHLVITRNYHPEEDGLTQGGPSGPSGNVACGSNTGNGVRLYINGQFHCSRYDGGTRYNWDQGLQLGLGNANDNDFDGNMDGFAIWDDDLTANEVSRIYDLGRGADLTSNSGNYTSSSDLEIFYDFNEGSGTALDDKTGNSSQDGTVSGASFIATIGATSVTTNEDTAKAITLSASDVDGDNLTYSIVTNVSNGSTSLSGSTVTYTPTANFNGTDSFTWKANDGTVDSATGNVNITITAVNDVPVASAVSASTNEDTAKAITLSATDVEGSSLTYSIVSNPSNGSLGSVSGTGVTYTPSANWNGTDTFTYKANDGTADSNTATVTVTVAAVNDAPLTINRSDTFSEDDTSIVTITGASDVEGDNLTYSVVSNPSNGSVTSFGSSGLSGNQLRYTPTTNWNGTDTFTYKVNDGTDDSNTSTQTIIIQAVNDAPTAADVTLNLPYESDHSYSIDMTTGANDVDGDNLTYQMLSTDNLTGSYSHDGSSGTGTFTSNANFIGSAGYITYRASDGTAWSHSNTTGGKIFINITDAPGGRALSFDGSGDQVTISEDASLVSSALTYQAWIKPAQANGTGNHLRIISRGNDGGSQNRLIVSHDPDETIQFGLFSDSSNGGRSETAESISTLSTTAWTHVVVTFGSGTSSNVGNIYLNGSLDKSFNWSENDASHVDSGGLRIGSDGGASVFNGKIDEVAFWNEVLTAAEVAALYNSGNSLDAASNSGDYTSSSGLKGYWKMSEQAGSTVGDSSSESNFGVRSNATWSTE